MTVIGLAIIVSWSPCHQLDEETLVDNRIIRTLTLPLLQVILLGRLGALQQCRYQFLQFQARRMALNGSCSRAVWLKMPLMFEPRLWLMGFLTGFCCTLTFPH